MKVFQVLWASGESDYGKTAESVIAPIRRLQVGEQVTVRTIEMSDAEFMGLSPDDRLEEDEG